MNAASHEVVLDDSVAQELIALLRTVASEGVLACHLIYSLVHGLDDCGAEGLGDVSYSKTDDVGLGM